MKTPSRTTRPAGELSLSEPCTTRKELEQSQQPNARAPSCPLASLNKPSVMSLRRSWASQPRRRVWGAPCSGACVPGLAAQSHGIRCGSLGPRRHLLSAAASDFCHCRPGRVALKNSSPEGRENAAALGCPEKTRRGPSRGHGRSTWRCGREEQTPSTEAGPIS